MYSTNSITVFIEKNDAEFRRVVTHLCNTLSFPGSSEDIIQDIYLKFLTSSIIQHFNTERPVKMTTYLYPIIKNFIISKLKSREYRIQQKKPHASMCDTYSNADDIDLVLCQNPIALDFQQKILSNALTDSVDGIGADIREFEKLFRGSAIDKKILQRKNKKDCCLSYIFRLLYEGYSNREIAEEFDISSMSVINMKRKLADIMIKYGFDKEQTNDQVELSKMSV